MADITKLSAMTYVIVFGASIANLGAGILEPTVAPYLEVLGANSQEIGTVISSRFLMVALISLPLALFASKFGLHLFLYAAAIVIALGGFILVYFEGIPAIYGFYLTVGVSQAVFNGPGVAIIAENKGSYRVAAFSLLFSTWMIPTALGAAISAIWFQGVTDFNPAVLASIFPIAMYVMLAGSVIYIVFLLIIRTRNRTSSENSKTGQSSTTTLVTRYDIQVPMTKQFKLLFAPAIVLPLIFLFLFQFLSGAGAGSTLPYLTPYLKSLGATPTELSILVFLLNFFMGSATQLTAPLSNRFGDIKIFTVTQIMSVIFLLGIVFTQELFASASFFILRGTFANMNAPITSARIIGYIEPSVRATGSATSSTIRWTGWTVFSPISGQIIDELGYNTSFVFTSILYAFALVLFLLIISKYPSLEDQQEEKDQQDNNIIDRVSSKKSLF